MINCCSLHCCCRCCCSYDMDSLSDDEGAAARGHITNYAQNVNGTVWNLDMLKQHLGERLAASAASQNSVFLCSPPQQQQHVSEQARSYCATCAASPAAAAILRLHCTAFRVHGSCVWVHVQFVHAPATHLSCQRISCSWSSLCIHLVAAHAIHLPAETPH